MRKKNAKQHPLWVKLCYLVFALFLFSGQVNAQTADDYKNTNVSLKVTNMPLSQVLDTLAEMTDVKFFYNHAQINANKPVTLDVTDRALSYVLNIVLADQAVDLPCRLVRCLALQ